MFYVSFQCCWVEWKEMDQAVGEREGYRRKGELKTVTWPFFLAHFPYLSLVFLLLLWIGSWGEWEGERGSELTLRTQHSTLSVKRITCPRNKTKNNENCDACSVQCVPCVQGEGGSDGGGEGSCRQVQLGTTHIHLDNFFILTFIFPSILTLNVHTSSHTWQNQNG